MSEPFQNELLKENNKRYTIKPIQYPEIWKIYENQRASIWFEHEIEDDPRDKADWEQLSSKEQHFIKYILAFFATADGIVAENIGLRFLQEVQIIEAQYVYRYQQFIEDIHNTVYSNLLITYISDPDEREQLMNSIVDVPVVRKKAEWAQKWIVSNDEFSARLIAFACVEGIFFSGSFCCIYWIKQKSILPALCKANDFISNDEWQHTAYGCYLYRTFCEPLPDEVVHNIVKEAVEIEYEFITETLNSDLLGINSHLMKQYINYVANKLIVYLGHKPYDTNCVQPFSFMTGIGMDSKVNFFERKVHAYQMQVKGEDDENDRIDDLDFNNLGDNF